jgi:hypothetical protein
MPNGIDLFIGGGSLSGGFGSGTEANVANGCSDRTGLELLPVAAPPTP